MANPCWLIRMDGHEYYALLVAGNGQVMCRTKNYSSEQAIVVGLSILKQIADSPIEQRCVTAGHEYYARILKEADDAR